MSLFFSLNRANVRHSSLSLALKNILPGNWIQTRFLTQVYYELFQALAIRSEYRMKIIMVIDGWTKNKTTKNIIFWLDCWFLSFDLFSYLCMHDNPVRPTGNEDALFAVFQFFPYLRSIIISFLFFSTQFPRSGSPNPRIWRPSKEKTCSSLVVCPECPSLWSHGGNWLVSN